MADSPAFMAARLKQMARDEKKVTANAARRGLRQVVRVAQSGFAGQSTLGRKLWGTAFWTGQKHTQRSLGIRRNSRSVLTGDAKKLRLYSAARDSARRAFQRAVGKGGSGIPLLVGLGKSRWAGDTWKGGVRAWGVAGNLESGTAFRPHRQGSGRHPGGRVPRRQSLEPALQRGQGAISMAIRQDVQSFMAEALR